FARARPAVPTRRSSDLPEGARAERCALTAQPPASTFVRDSISGVYVHATAVNNLIHRDALTEFSFAGSLTIAIVFAALIAAAARSEEHTSELQSPDHIV